VHKIYENQYDSCIYLITYSGDKHPAYYIGSVYLDTFYNGYKSSTSSKKWKAIVECEMNKQPNQYKIAIIQKCKSRELAFMIEHKLLLAFDARNNPLFWNMSNGYDDWYQNNTGTSFFKTPSGDYVRATLESADPSWVQESPHKGKLTYKTPDGCYRLCLPKDANPDWVREGNVTTGSKWYKTTDGERFLRKPSEAKPGWVEEGNTLGHRFYKKPNGEMVTCLPKDANPDWVREGPNKGVKKPKIKCPYCSLEGYKPNMNRWHFDNCKKKKENK